MIPFDQESAFSASGIRLGTPAVTTRGMKTDEMVTIAKLINQTLKAPEDEKNLQAVRREVEALTKKFPLYPELLEEERL